jgi:ubiquinone biosynthesis protein
MFINTGRVFGTEYISYLLGRDKDTCIKNVIDKLSKSNILYVKILQGLSTNTNFSPEILNYINKYTDSVPYTNKDIDKSFMRNINDINYNNNEELLCLTSEVPIKSGVIALIYEGMIGNQKVVIKVKKNNIYNKLLQSLDEIDIFLKIISFFPYIKYLNTSNIITENRKYLLEQTDFIKEINNNENVYKNFENSEYFVIPKVYRKYTEKYPNMIVMDYINGNKINNVVNDDKEEYSKLVAKFGLQCVLKHSIYHGDLHPGNILFINENGKKQIGILDYGIVGKITKEEKNIFLDFLYALSIEKNDRKAIELLINKLVEPKSIVDKLTNEEYNNLFENVRYVINKTLNTKKGSSSLGPDDLYNINKILYNSNLYIRKSFSRLEIAIAISESICKELSYNNSYMDSIKESLNELFTILNID